MKEDYLKFGGVVFVLIIICLIIIIPTIATIVIGMWIANQLGLSGIVWWSFLILFWLIVSSIISKLSTISNTNI